MSNSRGRNPAPPPPAPPYEEELTIGVISIGAVAFVSLVLLCVFLWKMGHCKWLAHYCHCEPDAIPPPPPASKQPLAEDFDDEEKGNGFAGPTSNGGILASMCEEEEEEEDAKSETELSEGSLAAQRVFENAWANPVDHTSEGNLEIGQFDRLSQPEWAVANSKPPPPSDGRKRSETMDQKLRRQSVEREEAALHLKHAREQRAKFMKRGGRPSAADYAEWNPNSGAKATAVDKNSLEAVQAAHDAWVAECAKEDHGHVEEPPAAEEIAKAAAAAVRGRRASQGGSSRSLWVAPDVLS
mmetsp:Transcript_17447/g.41502  ORF Transcript_17447/g.41502 Transcript_17447/m.41502 type:complete len:298 (+) Transcript_17447:107-1000(+)